MEFHKQFCIFDRYGYVEFYLESKPNRYYHCYQYHPVTLAQRLQIFLLNGAIEYSLLRTECTVSFLSKEAAEHYSFLNPDSVSPAYDGIPW